MDSLSKIGFKAVNLYFSAICNLQCRYCFQPKIHEIGKKVNDEVIQWIVSGRMEDDIQKYFGNDIEYICLWGGEPSINLPYLIERMDIIYNKFLFLKEIQYSTNISTKRLAQNTVDFIQKIEELNNKYNRKVQINLQFSIDGPPELNDYNRIGAKADTIMENITYIVDHLPKSFLAETGFHSVRMHIKGTQSADNLKWLLQDNNLLSYYKYFDRWQAIWESKIPTDLIPIGATFITCVYPGNYTQEDGLNFKKLVEIQNSKEFQTSYDWESSNIVFDNQITSRIKEAFYNVQKGYYRDYKGELLSNCTCSAGRSCLGLSYDHTFHLCHSTYMFTDEVLKYIDDNNLTSEFEEKQGFSFRLFNNNVKNNLVFPMEDELRCSRTLYKMNDFNNNLSSRVQYLDIMVSSLAAAGQISECFNTKKWRDLAVIYLLFGGNDCPINNVWEFGSLHIRNNAQMKLVLNGAFEYFLNNVYTSILDIDTGDVLKSL